MFAKLNLHACPNEGDIEMKEFLKTFTLIPGNYQKASPSQQICRSLELQSQASDIQKPSILDWACSFATLVNFKMEAGERKRPTELFEAAVSDFNGSVLK